MLPTGRSTCTSLLSLLKVTCNTFVNSDMVFLTKMFGLNRSAAETDQASTASASPLYSTHHIKMS